MRSHLSHVFNAIAFGSRFSQQVDFRLQRFDGSRVVVNDTDGNPIAHEDGNFFKRHRFGKGDFFGFLHRRVGILRSVAKFGFGTQPLKIQRPRHADAVTVVISSLAFGFRFHRNPFVGFNSLGFKGIETSLNAAAVFIVDDDNPRQRLAVGSQGIIDVFVEGNAHPVGVEQGRAKVENFFPLGQTGNADFPVFEVFGRDN